MKHFPWITKLICGLVMFVAAACSAPATLQPSPSLPPPAPKPSVPATRSIIVTYEGGQCPYEGPEILQMGKVTIDWIVKDKDYDRYGLFVTRLQAGKTIDDIMAVSSEPTAPAWMEKIGYWETKPQSSQQVTAEITQGPIYFILWDSRPETRFCVIGPVQISSLTPQVVFEGEQCTYTGPASIPVGTFTVDWTVKNPGHEKYALVILNLTQGKTFKDIDEWPSADPPPWINIVGYAETKPDSQIQVTAKVAKGPLFFVCFYSPPDTKFDVAGPLEILGEAVALPPLPTITPHPAPTAPAHPRPVIIDTDMGADDWMAILYLLQRTDLAIQAISISGTGLTHCQPGVEHAVGLVALAGHDPVPVACGRETPMAGSHVFPDSYREAADSIMGTGLALPVGKNPATEKTAAGLLAAAIQSAPEKIVLLMLGPSTNIADLLQQHPGLAEKIMGIYMMGGAVRVPGNLFTGQNNNTVAEWNVFIDPRAANIVLSSGIPVTMVPLDATKQVPISDEFYRRLEASRLTSEAKWIYDLFTKEQGYFQSSDYYFWDPLAAAVLANERLVWLAHGNICVEEQKEPLSGQTYLQEGCPRIRYAISADAGEFEQEFLDTLNHP